MFLVKKFLGPLLVPHSIFLGLLVIGVVLLWFSSKRRLAKSLVTIAAAGFMLLSYPGLWGGFIESMENHYPVLDLQKADVSGIRWIVVLGGGGTTSDSLPATGQLSSPSQARLVEGIRILNAIPQAKLLVSGRSGLTQDSEALMMRDAAQILGVNAEQIVVENKAVDTEQQAKEIKVFVGRDRHILVTSAIHMPRAMGLFAKQDLVPIPAPADFLIKEHSGSMLLTPGMLVPSSTGGPIADSLFHEWLGTLWGRLRGHI